jgi:hypothetical protein
LVGFFLKTRVFSNPASRVKLSPLPAAEVSLGEEEDEESARLQFKAFMHREQFKAVLRSRIRIWIYRIHMFWASWIQIRILLSLSKYSKKNLDFYCFVTSF